MYSGTVTIRCALPRNSSPSGPVHVPTTQTSPTLFALAAAIRIGTIQRRHEQPVLIQRPHELDVIVVEHRRVFLHRPRNVDVSEFQIVARLGLAVGTVAVRDRLELRVALREGPTPQSRHPPLGRDPRSGPRSCRPSGAPARGVPPGTRHAHPAPPPRRPSPPPTPRPIHSESPARPPPRARSPHPPPPTPPPCSPHAPSPSPLVPALSDTG